MSLAMAPKLRLEHLPSELLCIIVSHLSKSALLHLSASSRRLREVVQPLAYEIIQLRQSHSMCCLKDTLHQRPDLAKRVRSLSCCYYKDDCSHSDGTGADQTRDRGARSEGHIRGPGLLRQLDSLVELDIKISCHPSPFWKQELDIALVDNRGGLKSLRRVYLHEKSASVASIPYQIPLLQFEHLLDLPKLRELVICGGNLPETWNIQQKIPLRILRLAFCINSTKAFKSLFDARPVEALFLSQILIYDSSPIGEWVRGTLNALQVLGGSQSAEVLEILAIRHDTPDDYGTVTTSADAFFPFTRLKYIAMVWDIFEAVLGFTHATTLYADDVKMPRSLVTLQLELRSLEGRAASRCCTLLKNMLIRKDQVFPNLEYLLFLVPKLDTRFASSEVRHLVKKAQESDIQFLVAENSVKKDAPFGSIFLQSDFLQNVRLWQASSAMSDL